MINELQCKEDVLDLSEDGRSENGPQSTKLKARRRPASKNFGRCSPVSLSVTPEPRRSMQSPADPSRHFQTTNLESNNRNTNSYSPSVISSSHSGHPLKSSSGPPQNTFTASFSDYTPSFNHLHHPGSIGNPNHMTSNCPQTNPNPTPTVIFTSPTMSASSMASMGGVYTNSTKSSATPTGSQQQAPQFSYLIPGFQYVPMPGFVSGQQQILQTGGFASGNPSSPGVIRSVADQQTAYVQGGLGAQRFFVQTQPQRPMMIGGALNSGLTLLQTSRWPYSQ